MSEGLLELLRYVFAGLVASWVFYGLTAHKRPTPFERVVQALIYTAVIQLTAELIGGVAGNPKWAGSLPFIMLLSLLLGFFLAVAVNNGLPHKWLVNLPFLPERWKITSKSAYGSNLSHAFETRREYIVLTLKDGRRILGWPHSWPDHPDEDYFILAPYEWLPKAGEDPDAVAAVNRAVHPNGAILIAAKDADVIEFVPSEKPEQETAP